jgi:hypothetical protein
LEVEVQEKVGLIAKPELGVSVKPLKGILGYFREMKSDTKAVTNRWGTKQFTPMPV